MNSFYCRENWYVLYISIISKLTVEQAFNLFYNQKIRTRKNNTAITEEDIKYMIVLKNTHTYSEIGKLYNLSGGAVDSRIRRYIVNSMEKNGVI